jgi:hypothetical protein
MPDSCPKYLKEEYNKKIGKIFRFNDKILSQLQNSATILKKKFQRNPEKWVNSKWKLIGIRKNEHFTYDGNPVILIVPVNKNAKWIINHLQSKNKERTIENRSGFSTEAEYLELDPLATLQYLKTGKCD